MTFAGGETQPGSRTLGDFRILREIGRGGMGVVYLAEQVSLRRVVALKVLPLDLTASPARVERFKREAESAARLHHPHIVPIHAAGAEEGQHWIAMEYVEGTSLDRVLEALRGGARGDEQVSIVYTDAPGDLVDAAGEPWRPGAPKEPPAAAPAEAVARRPLDASSVARGRPHVHRMAELFEKVCRALHHAHEQGIIHRDIKPANVLLDTAGEPHVTDFGLAHEEGTQSLTRTGDMIGTPLYMSPEQLTAKRVPIDRRTDVYSLGVSLYQALSLRPPFEAESSQEVIRQILFAEPPAPRKENPSIPRDLETIVLKSLEKNPERRYANARELADDLQRFLREEPISARRASLPYRVWKKARSARVSLAASIGIAIGAAAGLFLLVVVVIAVVMGSGRSPVLTSAAGAAYANAKTALTEKNLAEALPNARKAAELEPSAAHLELLGDVLSNSGDLSGAAEAYGRALASDERENKVRAGFRKKYAKALTDAGRPKEAVDQWSKVIVADPTDYEAFQGRGYAHNKLGDGPRSVEDSMAELTARRARAEKALDGFPDDPAEPIAPDRIERAREAIQHDPPNVRANLFLGYAELRAGAPDRAAAFFRTALGVDANSAGATSADASLALARAAAAMEQWADSRAAVDAALKRSPELVPALLLSSELREREGDLGKAVEDADRAVRFDPRSVVARLRRGAARFARADLAGARDDFEAVALAPGENGRRASLASAVCSLATGDATAARQVFERACESDRDDAAARLLAGVAAEAAADHAGAISHFSAALSMPAVAGEATVRRAFAFLGLRRLAEAWDDLDAALDRNGRLFAQTLDLVVHGGEREHRALLDLALARSDASRSPQGASPEEERRRLAAIRESFDPHGTVGPPFLLGRITPPTGERRTQLLTYCRAFVSGGQAREFAERQLREAGVDALPLLAEVATDRESALAAFARVRAEELDRAAEALVGEWLCATREPLPPEIAALGGRAPVCLERVLLAWPHTIVGARARAALVRLGGEAAASVFERALSRGGAEAKLHALVGLAALALPGTAGAVETALDPDEPPVLRAYASHALAAVGGRDAIGRLREVLREESDAFVRETAVRELASLGDRMGLLLLSYLERRPGAAEGFARTLGIPILGGARPAEEPVDVTEVGRMAEGLSIPPYLARALRSEDLRMQAGAARALGDLWNARTPVGEGPVLSGLVFDFAGKMLKADPRVRIAALETLTAGGDAGAADRLARFAADEDPATAALAAEALARLCRDRRAADAPADLDRLPEGARRIAAETLHLEADSLPAEKRTEAIRLWDRAAELATKWGLPLARAGAARIEGGEAAEGHEAIRAALARSPEDPATLAFVGEHRRKCPARCGSASECFRALLAARPGDPIAIARLSRALAADGDPTAARGFLDQARAKAGEDAESLLACAEAAAALSDREETYRLLRSAIRGGYPRLGLLGRDLGDAGDARLLDLLRSR